MPRADAERLLAYALERGIDFLDDARYDDETGKAPIPTGYSEVLFGELLRAVGADSTALTISNKLWWEFWPGQDAIGEVDASLQRMGLDRLGLLYSSTLPAEVPVPVAVEQIAGVLATGRVEDPRRAAALRLGAALRRPADALGTSPATLAIAFTLLHPRAAATLIGATSPAQVDAAIDAIGWAERITPDDVAELRDLAAASH